jgi:VWFA-related protein
MHRLNRAPRPDFSAKLVSLGVLAFFLAFFSFLSLETHGQQTAPVPPAANGQTQTAPQQNSSPSAQSQSAKPNGESSGEMDIKDEQTLAAGEAAGTFRSNVRLVLAPVIVRDSHGRIVDNLRKEDFELLDNGKPQVISHFAVEKLVAAGPSTSENSQPPAAKTPVAPTRYLVYLFDDLHLAFEDITRARKGAEDRLQAMSPTDRVAIFSTSGNPTLDFTDDKAKLHQALEQVTARPSLNSDTTKCPDITLYMADLIYNKHDPDTTQTAINDYLWCSSNVNGTPSPTFLAGASSFVQGVAAQVLSVGQRDSRLSLIVLKDTIRRIAAMPGQRTVIVVSPGFLTPQLEYDYYDVIDRALRAQVVISTIDARGLYVTIPFGDASQYGRGDVDWGGTVNSPGTGQAFTPESRAQLMNQEAAAQDDVLSVLAYSTGGTFFHNNNDMGSGFREVAEAPETRYVLGFTPQNLKTDGKFHTLKVNVKLKDKYDLQARRGYYAPSSSADAVEEAKREIQDELLSSEELHDLPVQLRTQFFKPTDDSAKLTVLAHVDVTRLRYKKADGRNENDVTLLTAVFDRNGNFLQGNQKLVQMRWKDETLARLGPGITLKASFDVKPGNYMVRVVARDDEQQMMSAVNGTVEIP